MHFIFVRSCHEFTREQKTANKHYKGYANFISARVFLNVGESQNETEKTIIILRWWAN